MFMSKLCQHYLKKSFCAYLLPEAVSNVVTYLRSCHETTFCFWHKTIFKQLIKSNLTKMSLYFIPTNTLRLNVNH